MRGILKFAAGWLWRQSSAHCTPLRGTVPRARTRLNVEEFERRDCPSVFNEVHVTDSFSLEQAWAKVTDITDPAYENQARIIIDNEVTEISLENTLITVVPLTVLEITTEDNHEVIISQSDPTGEDIPWNQFRFMDHAGNNGLSVTFSNLYFMNFGAPVTTFDNGDGGTIRTVAQLTLNNCTFINSVAGGSGGIIYTSNTLSATNCLFGVGEDAEGDFGILPGGNSAENNGGAICFFTANGTLLPLTLTGCSFINNTATNGDGGAIYYYTAEGTLTITDNNADPLDPIYSFFIDNTAPNGQGGAIYQFSGTIYATSAYIPDPFDEEAPGGNFDGNSDSLASDGDAMYLFDLSGATIDMAGQGGVVLVSSIPPPALPPGSQGTINATRWGGGITSNWPLSYFY